MVVSAQENVETAFSVLCSLALFFYTEVMINISGVLLNS
jgi:hypothetical protein